MTHHALSLSIQEDVFVSAESHCGRYTNMFQLPKCNNETHRAVVNSKL